MGGAFEPDKRAGKSLENAGVVRFFGSKKAGDMAGEKIEVGWDIDWRMRVGKRKAERYQG